MITVMQERHIAALAELESQSFATPWSEAALREELRNPCALFLVDEGTNGEVRGYIGCHAILDEGYITNVAVAPLFRRKGVGDGLISALQKQARDRALAFLTLEVRASNHAAITLYSKTGFLPVGVRKNYYSAPIENALLMTYDINEA